MIPELRLFGGGALLAADGQPVSGAAAQPRRLAVLAVLADSWPAPVTRDRLIGLLWPECDEAGARRLLTQSLYALRRDLGEFAQRSARDLRLDPGALRTDLVEFKRALADGDVERAVAEYRGPVLEGFHLRGASEFERWAESLRESARREFQRAVETLVAQYVDAGRARDAAHLAERLVQAAPYSLGAAQTLMALWERAGDPDAALAAGAAYERRMREELGVEPDAAVRVRAAELRAAGAGEVQRATSAQAAFTLPAAPTTASPATASPAMTSPTPSRIRRPRWTMLAGAIAIAVSAFGLSRLDDLEATTHLPMTITPFAVQGDSAHESPLGDAVARLLDQHLRTATSVLPVTGGSAPEDTASGARPARGAGMVLSGIVTQSSGAVRIDARLRTASATQAATFSVGGRRDSLATLIERLSLLILPALYPELERGVDRAMIDGFTRVAALRSYLDGEAAMRRGTFGQAHAAFRTATEQDSSQAYVWYRRAVAAELVHQNGDADLALAAARARAASLDLPTRELLRGYSAWRAGDALAAETIFRQLIAAAPDNRDAWGHFAEIAYHAWPLHGIPLDAAGDAWRRVVALDSSNFPALMHAIRLEARARDTATVESLLQRIAMQHPDPHLAAEARVIAAHGVGDARARAAANRTLDSLPGYSLHYLQAIVAGYLEDPVAATRIARRMTGASFPDAVRGDGRIALANLAVSQGQWRRAFVELDSAAALNPVAAAWARAYLTALPFYPAPVEAVLAAERALASTASTPAAAPLYLQLAVEAPAGRVIRDYLGHALRVGGPPGSTPPAAACDAGTPVATRELCADLAHGLAAQRARLNGDHDAALAQAEALTMRVPYQFAGRSAFFARTRGRFLRAQLLEEAGRDSEAYGWYASLAQGARMDYVFLAPSHLGRGRISERRGDHSQAAGHYRKALELWRDADPEVAAMREEARQGLARTEGR